ncbi:MFS transporter [Gandjariella thermophila]|uniref:MFS transporter n=1 Tax=Gandjariella thermophila TaxID=1931992 RepID=UPI0010F503FB|nr:MFS transporter [Gandjariella thermophila]
MPDPAGQRRRLGPRRLLAQRGYRRLLASRLAAQWGDGVFQAGLAGAVLFNPERQTDPLAIAGGFAVLLLPYSGIGPFAGALLDRWDRRRVLVVANLLRGVLVLLTALLVGAGVGGAGLYAAALLVTGVSRFVNSGLSASLPHLVRDRYLVEGNAFAVTSGAVISVVGAACAVGLRGLFGAGNHGSALTTAVAVLGSLTAASLAGRFARGSLGPDAVDEPAATMVAVAHGLLDGGRAALRATGVAAGFAALLAHRAAFGASLLMTVLLLRYSFHDIGPLRAGLPGLGEAATAGGAGLLAAGLVTARIVARFGRPVAVCGALLLAAVAQLGLGLPMTLPAVLLAAFLVTGTGQVVKLCVDAAVQQEVGDETRGRVFSVYDMLFNVTQVVAITVTAMLVPTDGRSPGLVVAATLVYLVGLVGYLLVRRARRGTTAAHRQPAGTACAPAPRGASE